MRRHGSPEGRAFVRRVLEDPYDTTVRLVYADWLEEEEEGDADDAARAHFIRHMVRTADRDGWVAAGPVIGWGALQTIRTDLLAITYRPELEAPGAPSDGEPDSVQPISDYRLDRGFVSAVALPSATFMRYANRLFRRHPIVAVRLTDLDCGVGAGPGHGEKSVWQRFGAGGAPYNPEVRVPDQLYRRMPFRESDDFGSALEVSMRDINTYPPNREVGLRWLSDACVAHGRARARLPELTLNPEDDPWVPTY